MDGDQGLKEAWRKKALGDFSEAKVFEALESIFQRRASVMLTGVKVEKILQVARQAADHSLNKHKDKSNKFAHLFSIPLTTEERTLGDALDLNPSQLEKETKELIALTAQTSNITQNDLQAAVKTKKVKPGFYLLDEKNKDNCTKTLNREIKIMFERSKRVLTPDEVENYLERSLLKVLEKKTSSIFVSRTENPAPSSKLR